ncbi:MAG: hypothetical protein H7A37_09135 [Chlamydiales bacterium]|nr:hypothetical protein [Chlamydiales bacterium]
MSKINYSIDNCLQLWIEKIYNSLPANLNETDLLNWGFLKNRTQLRREQKKGSGPPFIKIDKNTVHYPKEDLIEWHQSQPEATKPVLHFPQERKESPEARWVQLQFNF